MEEAGNVIVVVGIAERPEKSNTDFVSDGDDFERDVVRCKCITGHEGIVI